ncbi:MAG: class I SAM-dependent methyltransferase [Thermoleophilia bacterium]|nr:class I SAM-dependent methyltransferase [Thermoleophilia bacterium]
MKLNDPEVVRRDYATEDGLAARRAAYRSYPTTGPHAVELAVRAVAEAAPRRLLEVGCGDGELAERLSREVGCEVVALDQSERMIELTRGRGIDTRLGDVQQLPFADGEFDCAVAAWMLYHVPDVDRAVAELARVLRPGGRLVATTNALDHLHELRDLVGRPRTGEVAFGAENGAAILRRHFRRVVVHDAGGTITFPDRAAVLAYVRASITLAGAVDDLPGLDGPLVATRHPVVLVADKAP